MVEKIVFIDKFSLKLSKIIIIKINFVLHDIFLIYSMFSNIIRILRIILFSPLIVISYHQGSEFNALKNY